MYDKVHLEQLRAQLDLERAGHITKWTDIADYIAPTRQRFQITDRNRGDRRNQRILDSTATLAVRTLKSGMMSGITSPARPWFRLSTQDPELDDDGEVKAYLHQNAQILRDILLKSNFYSKMPQVYGDLALFGTAALGCVEDPEDVVRFATFPIGSYWIACDDRERVDTFLRQTTMTARQLVARFGDQAVSIGVRQALANNQGEQPFQVHQAIMRHPHPGGGMGAHQMPWVSCWYEAAGDPGRMLGVSGFREMPVFCPRWETVGEDAWGDGIGVDIIGDVKQLQAYERKAVKGVDKTIDPPLVGPAWLQHRRVSLVPGDITYANEMQGAGALRPIHETRFDLNMVEAKQEQCRRRIRSGCYADLFLMLAESDRRQITATEIDARREEKLLALGPVLERLNDELLDPVIDRVWAIAERRRLLRPPPQSIEGLDLKVEYISVMANAQRAVAMGATRGFLSFVATAAQIQPDALDKLDVDQAVDEVGEQLGVNPQIIRPTDEARAIRTQRAQAQQQVQAAQMQAEQARTAQALANTPINTDTALSQLAQLAGAGAL